MNEQEPTPAKPPPIPSQIGASQPSRISDRTLAASFVFAGFLLIGGILIPWANYADSKHRSASTLALLCVSTVFVLLWCWSIVWRAWKGNQSGAILRHPPPQLPPGAKASTALADTANRYKKMAQQLREAKTADEREAIALQMKACFKPPAANSHDPMFRPVDLHFRPGAPLFPSGPPLSRGAMIAVVILLALITGFIIMVGTAKVIE